MAMAMISFKLYHKQKIWWDHYLKVGNHEAHLSESSTLDHQDIENEEGTTGKTSPFDILFCIRGFP